MKGAVDAMDEPQSKSEPIKGGGTETRAVLVFNAKRGDRAGEVRLEYQFGQVAITEPWAETKDAKPATSSAP
jgi:hypothetical protein